MNTKNSSVPRAIIIITILLILGLGTFLRFYHLGVKSFWLDEINQVQIVSQPLSQMISPIISSDHPPLFFLIHHFFVGPGYDEFTARLPAVIFGILSILAVYVLGRNTLGEAEGLIGAYLLAISTINVANAQNARNYTIFIFLSILSLNSFYQAFWKNNKNHYWFWIVTNVLALYTHYFGIFMVFSEGVFAFVYFARTSLRNKEFWELKRLLGGISLTGLAFCPWVYISFYHQAARGGGFFSYYLKPESKSFLILADYFLYGIWDVSTVRYPKFPLIILGSLGLLGIIWKRNPAKNPGINLLTFFPLIVLVTVFSLAFTRMKVITPRNLLFIFPAIYLLIGRGTLLVIQGLIPRIIPKDIKKYYLAGASAVFALILGYLNYSILVNYYNEGFHLEKYRGSWKQVLSFVKGNLNPNDGILILGNNEYLKSCLDYYLEKEKIMDRVEYVDNVEALKSSLDHYYSVFLLLPNPSVGYAYQEDGEGRKHRGYLNLFNSPFLFQDKGLMKIIRENAVSARHLFLLDIYYLDRSPVRLKKYYQSVPLIGPTRKPGVIDSTEYISASIFPFSNIVKGRYAVLIFSGGNLTYRFYCEGNDSFSLKVRLYQGDDWLGTATARLALDSHQIGEIIVNQSDRWISRQLPGIKIGQGYHELVLEVSSNLETDIEKGVYLDEISISPNPRVEELKEGSN